MYIHSLGENFERKKNTQNEKSTNKKPKQMENKMNYSLEERCAFERFGDRHGSLTQALNRSKEDFDNGSMSFIADPLKDNFMPAPINAKVNTFPFYKESSNKTENSDWTSLDEIGVNYIMRNAKQIRKNAASSSSSDETEVFAYSCPNDDTLIFLPQNKDLVTALGWYAECGIVYEIDEDPARRFKVDAVQYKTVSSYFGKKFEMSQYDNMAQFIGVLRELIAVQQKLAVTHLPPAMAPSIRFFEEPAWDRNAVLNIPICFQTYACVDDVLTAKIQEGEKSWDGSRIHDAGGDKVAMHVLTNPSCRVLFEQEHPQQQQEPQQKYLFFGNEGKTTLKNANYQLRSDPPIDEELAKCLLTNRSSLSSQSIVPLIKEESKSICPHDADIFSGHFSSHNFMSYADLTRKTAWENTPVFVIVVFLHKQEMTTFVRVAETSNKNLLHHIKLGDVYAIRGVERIMRANPYFGFVPMIIFKTTSKEIVDHMSSSFQAKQFASFADVDIALKIEENFVNFVQNNEAVGLLMKPEEKEEENIRRHLQANFEIDNNPDHKYKAQDLFRFFGEAQQELGITVDVNFRNRLSKYLINLGLQKKRFSDGYYYFGLVRRSNEMK